MLLTNMFTTLLVVDDNVCTGLGCPLTLGILVYVLVAILGCCCCYPGACLCPQRPKKMNADGTEPNVSFLNRFNLLGSIAEVMGNELDENDIILDSRSIIGEEEEEEDDDEEHTSIRLRKVKF